MRKFRTQYERERVRSGVGSKIAKTYSARYDSDGRVVLDETGEKNIYDEIQSHRDSVDIHVLLKRFVNGDQMALNRVQGNYGDFTQFPATYADMLNLVNDGENFFNSLSVDVRAKFNHNFGEFVSAIGTDRWNDALGIKPAPVAPEPVEPVSEVVE